MKAAHVEALPGLAHVEPAPMVVADERASWPGSHGFCRHRRNPPCSDLPAGEYLLRGVRKLTTMNAMSTFVTGMLSACLSRMDCPSGAAHGAPSRK